MFVLLSPLLSEQCPARGMRRPALPGMGCRMHNRRQCREAGLEGCWPGPQPCETPGPLGVCRGVHWQGPPFCAPDHGFEGLHPQNAPGLKAAAPPSGHQRKAWGRAELSVQDRTLQKEALAVGEAVLGLCPPKARWQDVHLTLVRPQGH